MPEKSSPKAWREEEKADRDEGWAGGVAGSRKGSEQQCLVFAALPDVAGIAPQWGLKAARLGTEKTRPRGVLPDAWAMREEA